MGQVRLAERRGLLGGGRRLSRVQNAALELCLLLDARDTSKEMVDRFRMALVTHDPRMTEKLFPEWFMVETTEVTDEDLVNSPGKWRFTEKITPEEAMRSWQEATAAMAQGKLTMAQVEQAEDEGWI